MTPESRGSVPCLTCNCNGSIPEAAFASTPAPARALCRGDVAVFRDAVRQNGPVVVGCTQEAAFFNELADRLESPAELRFVNLRELAGWSPEAAAAAPKLAALVAMAAAPAADAVAGIDLVSGGSVAIVGPAAAAIDWAARLTDQLDVSVVTTDAAGLPGQHDFPIFEGREIRLRGHLGSFELSWKPGGPVDFDRCTACGACIRACPEQAMTRAGGLGPRHDAGRCTPDGPCARACVVACGEIAAISFDRLAAPPREERYDLVLDLSRRPLLRTSHLPDGYFAPGADPLAQSEAARKLATLVGEFEKPRYLNHSPARCAHHRQGKDGCTRCIDVCSTGAISSVDHRIVVDAGLCAGCGGCATVCPSGAARHAYPAPGELMGLLRLGLARYGEAGGRNACVLVHSAARSRALTDFGRDGRGLPARVIPFPLHDVASFGLDYALAALCYGAAQVLVMVDAEQPDAYRQALVRQLGYGNLILAAMGFGGERLALVDEDALGTTLWNLPLPAPLGSIPAASFVFPADKRAAFDLVLDDLAARSNEVPAAIPLPSGAPFGTLEVDAGACTLCMSCVGACPTSALLDTPEEPRLRFVERNCIQCGLCASTCPEQAIRLTPRLSFADEARRARTLNVAEPFHCVSCGKAFGTQQIVSSMLSRLAGHSMFAGEAAQRRLQMCADCRVLDMVQNPQEISVLGGRK